MLDQNKHNLLKLQESYSLPEFINIESIDYEEKIGLYAPLSQSGSMIVDDFVVSCFASSYSHYASYYATFLMTHFWKYQDLEGVHPYAKLLMAIGGIW